MNSEWGGVDETFHKTGVIAGNVVADQDHRVGPVFYLSKGGHDPAPDLQRVQVVRAVPFLCVQQCGAGLFRQLQGCSDTVNVCAKAANQGFA